MKISAVLRHRLFSILILAILFSTLLNAQMKIKERVSISPVQAPLLSTASGGEFTVQFQFDGELDPASASEVFVNQGSPCYAVYWGDRQATAPIMTGNFFAVIYLYARSPGTATYSYTANGQELMSVTMTISTSSWIIPFSCDFYESFKFDHDSVVVAPGTWENANIYGDGATICQPNAQWCPYYLTTWTVDQGSEWGQFYDENSKPVGTTYTARAADITGLAFQLSPNIPDTAFCIIKASSNGLDRYKKIYPPNYNPKELDHFKVTIVPDTAATADTVAFTEGAKLIIQAKDKDDNDVVIDANTLLKLSLLTNEEYGTFINANNDTLKTSPVQLTDILYRDAKAGKIKFAAVKKNPDSLVTCKIHVEKQGDPTKNGERDAVVLGLILKIQEHSPWTIWPYLPPQQSDKASRGADRPGYNPKRIFSIIVHDGLKRPRKNVLVKIFTQYEEGSGGHGHTGYADTGGTIPAMKSLQPDTLQGLFYYQGGKGKNPDTLTTNANGIAVADSFIASQASGKFLITARMVRDTIIMDSVNLQVKVDSLVDFGTGDYWSLTGNTSNRGRNHLSNHWCTQRMKDSLEAVLKDFCMWTKTKAGGGKAVKLGINDMCLQWGGAFDIPGTWVFNDQHSFHRIGLSVDIDNNPGYLRKDDTTLTDKGNRLVKIMLQYGGKKYKETPIHFGFDGEK